jgi:nucleotide-binding universal stress UspA family protein
MEAHMSIKRILVPLPGFADHSSEIDMALAAAQALEAYVEALLITEPVPTTSGVGEAGYAAARLAAARTSPELVDQRQQQTREIQERVTQACELRQVPLITAGEAIGTLPAAAFRTMEGPYADVAVRRAAAFDLMVATSAAVVAQLKDIAERSLLRTHRPVLLAPTQLRTRLTGPAMIAWDESLQCWHAVSAAIPFLKRAERVEVVSIDRNPTSRAATHAEVLAYLQCHGIEATSRVVAPDSQSIGARLLSTAADADAGLLVMGAYAHSRLREMLFGGATRHVLQAATTTPVLMAH